ncbi:MAG: TVP38/TMEM64 family protein [Nanoarchaeota archaeon]
MKKFNREKLKEKIKDHKLYKKTIENKYSLTFLLILVGLITYSYFTQGFVYNVANQDLQETQEFMSSFGSLAWLIYFVAILIEVIIPPIPSLVITVAGSITFGPLKGALLAIGATAVGNIIIYYISKNYGYSYIEKLISKEKHELFHRYSEKYGPFVLFILRLNPITSNDLFSYLAGLIGMPFWKFFISTMLGLIPMIFLLSYFGEAFVNNVSVFRILFIIITTAYIGMFVYFAFIIGKNKVKEKINNFRNK